MSKFVGRIVISGEFAEADSSEESQRKLDEMWAFLEEHGFNVVEDELTLVEM